MSVEIIRVKTPKIIGLIEQHLVFTDPSNKIPFMEAFVQMMTQAPETLLVLAAVDEDDNILAFCIAQNPGFIYSHIMLAQTWSHPNNDWSLPKRMFARVVVWAVSLGKEYIRGETQRGTAAIYRRFGFNPTAQVIRFDLNGIEPSFATKDESDG